MDDFEALLTQVRPALTRYIRFRLRDAADADDVLQETCLSAYRKFPQLRSKDAFKPWIISIARNKCADHLARRLSHPEVLMDTLPEPLVQSRIGLVSAVSQTMEQLTPDDQHLLHLYFWEELPQAVIARQLHIPVGTVKSRLYAAKQRFRTHYPHTIKGADPVKHLPALMPAYTIEASPLPPFSVKWEELMGWFLVPRLDETLTWGMYDMPSRQCSHVYDMKVTGKAKVHGIEGVELTAREAAYSSKTDVIHRTFVAQLTDTHCRYLAALRNDGDVRNYITFLDGEEFLTNWGFGENNIGNETNLSPKGDIIRNGNTITSAPKNFLLDIVGRYTVTINGKAYDTVCVMDIETYNAGVVAEQFLDASGRTVLWRRYNRDDWATDRYGTPWSQQLPENDRLTVNGTTYVHWYDCITDHIL